MERIPPSVSPDEFALLARRGGLDLNEEQRATLYAVFGNFEAMLERLRTPLGVVRPRGAEPSLVFVPTQGWTA